MLKKLTEIDAVSGNEKNLRDFIISQIKDHATSINVDTMGNIIAFKKGRHKTNHTFMACAHLDEVGFIVSKITDDGFIKFKSVGGIDDRILLTQRVRIGNQKGVIGLKAVHLQSADERKKVIKIENMYIDIGAKDKKEAEKKVKIGDYIAFDSDYEEFGNDFIAAKALDDRVGCFILMNAIKKDYANDMYFCFTVQEEVGLRGARVLAHSLNAEAAIIVECTTALDIPFTEPHETVTTLGNGPALTSMDRTTIQSKALNKLAIGTANSRNIPYQIKRAVAGGNDAGAISIYGGGCETVCISVPSRNIHSPVCVVKKSDVENAQKLVISLIEDMENYTPNTWEELK